MLVIRLARGGRAKYPTYRIVAAESSRAATGKFIEVLGHYNPHTKELVIKKEETIKRLSHGAQPSNSVVKLLQREKIEVPEWVKLQTKNRKPKSEPEEKPAAAPAPAEEAAPEAVEETATEAVEAPTEEAPTEEVVAAVAEENAEVVEEKAPDADATETAEDAEKKEEASEEASDAAAENAESAKE